MTNQEIINGLYRELLFVAVILIGILFVNNIVLYKQKLKDRISIMLLTSVALGCFEILWAFCDGHPEVKALTYIGSCGYMILFVVFTVFLNRYILSRFNRLPTSKWANVLFYNLPTVIFSALCVTTPWTHWFVSVDEVGVLHEETLFDALFTPLMVLYVLIAVISAVHYAIRSRHGDHATVRIIKQFTRSANNEKSFVLPYLDIEDDADYIEALNWATMNKLTAGVSKTEFAPDDLVTQEEIETSLNKFILIYNLNI